MENKSNEIIKNKEDYIIEKDIIKTSHSYNKIYFLYNIVFLLKQISENTVSNNKIYIIFLILLTIYILIRLLISNTRLMIIINVISLGFNIILNIYTDKETYIVNSSCSIVLDLWNLLYFSYIIYICHGSYMKLLNKKYKSFESTMISSSSDYFYDINHINSLLILIIYLKIFIFSIFFLVFNEKIPLNNEIYILITTSIVFFYLDKDIIINKYVDILNNYKVSFDIIYSLNQESNKLLFYGKNTGIFFTNHNSSMLIETQLQNLNYVSSQYLLQDNFSFPPTRINNIQYKFGRYIKNSQSHVISLDILDDIFIYSHDLTNLCLYNEHKSSPSVNYRESINSHTLFYLNCIGKDKDKDKDKDKEKSFSSILLKSFISETLEKSKLNSSYFSKLSSMSITNNFYGIFYLKENQNRLFSITIKFIKHNFYIVEANDITDLMNNVIAYNSNKFHKIILTKVVHEIKTPCIGINYLTSNVDRLLHKKFLNEEENSSFLYKTKVFKDISDSIIKIYCLSELIQNQITENKIYLSGLDFFEVNNSHILIEDILKWGKSILVSLLEHEDNKFHIVPNLIVESTQQHWIKSDERLLKIIIGHIIINAVKYTTKGEITIGIENISQFQMNDLKKSLKSKLNDGFFKENYENYICFYIKDTGKGFHEDYLKEINSENYLFNNEDIYKLSFSESGSLNIGLKLVKSICLLLNIGLIIESTQNTQTIIKFYIKSHFNKKSIEGIGNKELLNQLNGGEGMIYKNQIYDFKYESENEENDVEIEENTSKSSRDYLNYIENNEELEGNHDESKYNSSISTKKWSMKGMITNKNQNNTINLDNSNESESIHNLTFRNNTIIGSKKDLKDMNNNTIYNNRLDYHRLSHSQNHSIINKKNLSLIPINNEKEYKINTEFLNDMNKKLKSISSEDVLLNKNHETKKTFQISLKNFYSSKTIKSQKSNEDTRNKAKDKENKENNENHSSNKSSINDESDDVTYKNHFNFKRNNVSDSPSYPFSSHLESNNKKNDALPNFNLDFDAASDQNLEEDNENYKYSSRFRLRSETINPLLKDRLNEYFKYKILIVDDGSMVRKNLYTIINSIVKENNIPCVIECLTDGLEILTTVIKDYLDGDLPTKLIISDENMNWLNGSTALKILSNLIHFRKLYKMTTVILTALEEEEVLSIIKKEANCNYIFKKPIKKDLLKEIICGLSV